MNVSVWLNQVDFPLILGIIVEQIDTSYTNYKDMDFI